MVKERRIARLAELIKERVAEILNHEMADPRLGFVTVTRVELDRELTTCKVYWSCLGKDTARSLNEHALNHARGFIQREMAGILSTRSVPELRFVFDESIAGSIRLQNLIDKVNAEAREREARGTGHEPAPDKT